MVAGSESDEVEIRKLAEGLGYLPLALAMAAAYMRRCDVSFPGNARIETV